MSEEPHLQGAPSVCVLQRQWVWQAAGLSCYPHNPHCIAAIGAVMQLRAEGQRERVLCVWVIAHVVMELSCAVPYARPVLS